MKPFHLLLTLFLCLCLSHFALAKEWDAESGDKPAAEKSDKSDAEKKDDKAKDDKSKDKKDKEELVDKVVTTQHSTTINDKELKYTATAGKLVMKTDDGDSKAQMFFIAYSKDGVDDFGQRPITFAFNGGPGSSSVWLHLGMLGPKRIKIPDKPAALAPPYHLSSNPYTLLEVTDLVFIDPVSTGYSRPAKGENKDQFHGYDEDIRSVGQFIHNYVTKYGRWRSPKFVIGESYGGIRSAGLAGHLRERYMMPLNGIVMVSPALNFETLDFGAGNDLPFILFVPSYATTAWYHKALPGDLQPLSLENVFQQASDFATRDYAAALMKGQTLGADERNAVAEKLSRFTGLSKSYIESANLRVDMRRFAKELLRSRGRTVGRIDSRFTGIDADNAGEGPEYDPSDASIDGAFAASINDYLHDDLKFDDDHVYEVLTGSVHPWNFGSDARFPDASGTLRETMSANPFLKLYVCCGYYDLACPTATSQYSVQHMRLAPELQKNISFGYYEGGHMMYIYEPTLKRLRDDLGKFYESALQAASDDQSSK
jgi:carboxypeptidase C (cathepsin A)